MCVLGGGNLRGHLDTLTVTSEGLLLESGG